MNEVSIIINGVRYDLEKVKSPDCTCNQCDLSSKCGTELMEFCIKLLPKYGRFKKSDKKFEK